MTSPRAYNISEALLREGDDIMRRKGEQSGSVFVKGPSWFVRYSQWVQDGGEVRYRQVCRKVGPAVGRERLTKREARRIAFEKFVSLANGPSAVPQGRATVQQFVDVRFRPERIAPLKKGGREHYEGILRNHVLPGIGHVQLCEVNRAIVQALLVAKAAEGYSSQTVIHIRNACSAIFRHARLLGFFSGPLPTEDVKTPALRYQERRAFTWEQVERVAMLASHHDPQLGPLIRLLAATGLRIGEACALRWRSVQLEQRPCYMIVGESFTRSEFTTCKGDKLGDAVPLTAAAVAALREIPRRSPDDLVFFNRAGSPLDGPNVLNRYVKPAAAKLGLQGFTFHALRHTSATHAEQAGVSPEARQKFLRHSDRRTTARYTHPEAEAFVAAMERVQKERVN